MPAFPPPALLASDPVAINAVLIAVRQAARLLCDRATLLVLLHAHTGASRYGDFSGRTGLASGIVSSRLNQLCEDGLLVKIPYSRHPLRHAYHLTHMGNALFDVLALLATWEQAWPGAMPAAVRVEVHHLDCKAGAGRAVPARLHCGACGEPIHPRDITLRVSQKEIARMPAGSPTRRSSQDPAHAPADPMRAPLPQALGVLGDKWGIEVLVCAFFGLHQFSDFGASTGIATNILSDRLGRLVKAGLLRRTTEQDPRRKGLYLLTDKGRDFYAVLIAIQSWADAWIDHRVRSPVKLRHVPCQRTLEPVLVCEACEALLQPSQARLQLCPQPDA